MSVHGFEHYKAKDYSLAHALFSGSNHAGGQWKNWGVERILSGKAGELREYSVELLHAEEVKFEGHGQIQEALAAYINTPLLDPGYVPCKILIGALLLKMGSKAFPAARSLLSDALGMEPTNRMAWCYLGMAHRDDGRIADATNCFQAASNLEESNPLIPPWSIHISNCMTTFGHVTSPLLSFSTLTIILQTSFFLEIISTPKFLSLEFF